MQRSTKLDTPFGVIEVTATDANHVFVDGGVKSVNLPADDPRRSDGLTVNGVQLSVTAHLYRWADGSWRLGTEDNRESQYRSLHTTRADWLVASKMEASEAAVRKLRETLVPLVAEYLATPEGIELLARGEYDNARLAHERAAREHEEAKQALAEAKKAEREALKRRERAAGEIDPALFYAGKTFDRHEHPFQD